MSMRWRLFVLFLILCFGLPGIHPQTPPSKPSPEIKPDYSKEAFVVEQASTRIVFENDGSYKRESTARIRIQSDAAIQRYSVLTFPYQNSTESLQINAIRVRKPDKTEVLTPAENIQDMPSQISREAPIYSDLREKHVAVKGLSVGDVLEFQLQSQTTKPLVPGQFWYTYQFIHDDIVLQEQLQITIPRDRAVKWKSATAKPAITEENGRRIFTWTGSHLERLKPDDEKKKKEWALYQDARGKAPAPEIQLSTFQSWEEVGRWYNTLQQDRVTPTPEIRAKAAELTKGLADDNARLRAIYNYVSAQFHYIGISFGIGRYQPHAAAEVLSNQYGDCKDKHTLFAALLAASGLKAYPAILNSDHAIDPDVPSPGQFDHVITVVPLGNQWIWLDTTPEIAPFAYLSTALRDKPALVISGEKPPTLMNTPADPPSKALDTFQMDAKLNDQGILEGKVQRSLQENDSEKVQRSLQENDSEVVLRSAFRSVPLQQWKDLVQRISYASGFAGEVSDTTASLPEKTDEPFHIAYTYTRKDYGDWPNRRIVAAFPTLMFPSVDDTDPKLSPPIWLGAPEETHMESRLELPKGYTPELPEDIHLNEDFAEYDATYGFKNGVMSAERRFSIKLSEVPLSELDKYKKFSKTVENDYSAFIPLTSNRAGSSPSFPANISLSVYSYQSAIGNLPDSENSQANQAYNDARANSQKRDLPGALSSFNRAVQLDPKFLRAWMTLGEFYKVMRQSDDSIHAYRKAIEADPQQSIGYEALGFALVEAKKYEEAIPVWQQLIKLAPKNSRGQSGLGMSLRALKRYDEAAAAYEAAIDLRPDFTGLYLELGATYLSAGKEDAAASAYNKAVDLDPSAFNYNQAGWALADANKKLDVALQYAQNAVKQEEDVTKDTRLADVDREDLAHPVNLAAYWDTLGWAYFRMGNLEKAENYLNAAWTLCLCPEIADHLGQVYERQHKKQEAVKMYRAALFSFPHTPFPMPSQDTGATDKIRERLERLSPGSSKSRDNFMDASEEINNIRTVKLTRILPDTAKAEFFLLLARDPKTNSVKVTDVKFVSGSEELQTAAEKSLKSATFKETFPAEGNPQILRRGFLGCYQYSGCSFTLYLPTDVHDIY